MVNSIIGDYYPSLSLFANYPKSILIHSCVPVRVQTTALPLLHAIGFTAFSVKFYHVFTEPLCSDHSFIVCLGFFKESTNMFVNCLGSTNVLKVSDTLDD